MASSGQIKGITIKIEGDTSGLAKDLQAVNGDIKKTQAALKDVEKALELDPSNVELLEQKQALLNRQIEETRQKLELEQQAAEDAKQALEIGDITAEEYATLQAEVVQTQASLEELEGAADGSADSLEGTGEAAAEAGEEASESAGDFTEWGEVVKGAAAAATAALAAVGAAVVAMGGAVVEGTKALYNQANEISQIGDEIDKNSQRVGLAVDSYQRLDYIMKINGSSIDENIQGFKTLNNTFDDAVNGSKNAIDKFKRLGLSLEDIKGQNREELFLTVIKSLQNVTDESEKAAIANDLLGRSSMNLAPLLNSTNEEMEALAKQAEEYGVILSDDLVEDSAAYQDSLTLLDGAMTGFKSRIVGEFLPGLTDVTTGLAGMVAGVDGSEDQIKTGIENIVTTFETLAPQFLNTIDALLPSLLSLGGSILSTIATGIINNLGSILEAAFSVISQLATALLNPTNLELILNSAVNILLQLVSGLIDAIDLLIDPAVMAILTLVENLLSSDSIQKLIDAAIHIILSVVKGLTEAAPRLIPVAISAIELICNTLIDHLDEIILAAEDLIAALAKGLLIALPELLSVILTEIIPGILGSFIKLQTELPAKGMQWGKDLIEGFIEGIKKMITRLKQTVSNVAGLIADYLHFSVPDVGPLSDFDESGPDMIDTFIKGMESKQAALAAAAAQTGQIIYNGITGAAPDYTGQLAGISGQLAGMTTAAGGNYVINVMVGTTTLATAVISAQQMEALRSGGN